MPQKVERVVDMLNDMAQGDRVKKDVMSTAYLLHPGAENFTTALAR